MLVGKDLEDARLLGHQSRETSWTDRMLLELKRLRDPRIIAVTSNEPTSGGDMDWWFVRRGSNVNFCMTLQAKILHYKQSDPLLWHYEDLAHPAKSPGQQSRTLVSYARRMQRQGEPRYPYYLFYNPDSAPPPEPRWCFPPHGAITAIDGFAVAGHIAQHVSGIGFPISQKRYVVLAPLMVTLPQLLCACADDLPDPEEMVSRVDAIWKYLDDAIRASGGGRRLKPRVRQALPNEIQRIVDSGGPLDSRDSPIARDTVIFISGD